MAARTPRPAVAAEDTRLVAQAAAVAEQLALLDSLNGDAATEQTRPILRNLGEATLAFVLGLDQNRQLLSKSGYSELLGQLLDVPTRLGAVGETNLAVRVAEALEFCAPDDMNGQIALVHAQAGDRQRALELVLTNLEAAREPFIAEFRAGDVYRELGEADAAEAYYRRALALAKTTAARSEASLRITGLMLDSGREPEALAFLAQQRALSSEEQTRAQLPSVGRNEPCPCGSGKKYKKCHGA
jgi:uncharacterized protein YchJ